MVTPLPFRAVRDANVCSDDTVECDAISCIHRVAIGGLPMYRQSSVSVFGLQIGQKHMHTRIPGAGQP